MIRHSDFTTEHTERTENLDCVSAISVISAVRKPGASPNGRPGLDE